MVSMASFYIISSTVKRRHNDSWLPKFVDTWSILCSWLKPSRKRRMMSLINPVPSTLMSMWCTPENDKKSTGILKYRLVAFCNCSFSYRFHIQGLTLENALFIHRKNVHPLPMSREICGWNCSIFSIHCCYMQMYLCYGRLSITWSGVLSLVLVIPPKTKKFWFICNSVINCIELMKTAPTHPQ